MSGTRYFKVIDTAILEAINDCNDSHTAAHVRAKDFAKEHGLGEPVLQRYHLFDCFVAGFKMSNFEYRDKPDMHEEWVKPKNGRIYPRARKSSEIYKAWKLLQTEVNVSDEAVHTVLGWNCMTWFPTRPGFYSSPENQLFIFQMPKSCNELQGCEEITNIEYFELTEKAA